MTQIEMQIEDDSLIARFTEVHDDAEIAEGRRAAQLLRRPKRTRAADSAGTRAGARYPQGA